MPQTCVVDSRGASGALGSTWSEAEIVIAICVTLGRILQPRLRFLSPLPLWERSETKRSEVSGRGVKLYQETLPPLPNPLPHGERERTAVLAPVQAVLKHCEHLTPRPP